MGEEDDPFVANEVVEVDGTLSSLSIEIGSDGTQTKTSSRQLALGRCDLGRIATHGSTRSPAEPILTAVLIVFGVIV